MADKANGKTVWHPVDTDAFTGKMKKLWADIETKQAALNAAKEAFEAELAKVAEDATLDDGSPLIPDGCEPAFGYRFGRLAIASVKKAAKRSSHTPTALKLGG